MQGSAKQAVDAMVPTSRSRLSPSSVQHRMGQGVQAFLALKQMAAFDKVKCLEGREHEFTG